MKVVIIGTGYVGLPTGVGLAELGHEVVCVDREASKISKLQAGITTLYEEGLAELLQKNIAAKRISFTTSLADSMPGAALVIIAVGTPPHPVTQEADLRYLYAAATELAPYLKEYTVVANKSTVPVGTGDMIVNLISKTNPQASFEVVSLPEFLREGYAVYDFFNPDRIVVGTDDERARNLIGELYAPLLERLHQEGKDTKLLLVNRRSSETIKYASNSFLATKIHFINEMANFCEKTGANIYEVAHGMGLDKRIGSSFLNPGPGFGGSCFPKDTLALDFMARQNNVEMTLVHSTIVGNQARIASMAERILKALNPLNQEPTIGVLGLAFKNGTDDCRVSPAMQILNHLLEQQPQLKLRVFDPQAMENAKLILFPYGERIHYCASMNEVAEQSEVLAILTEWPEFKDFDLAQAALSMKAKVIVDCRNLLDSSQAKALGFTYQGIGLPQA